MQACVIQNACALRGQINQVAAVETDTPERLTQSGRQSRSFHGVISVDEEDCRFAQQVCSDRKASSSSWNAMVQECAAVPNTGMPKRMPASALLVPPQPAR